MSAVCWATVVLARSNCSVVWLSAFWVSSRVFLEMWAFSRVIFCFVKHVSSLAWVFEASLSSFLLLARCTSSASTFSVITWSRMCLKPMPVFSGIRRKSRRAPNSWLREQGELALASLNHVVMSTRWSQAPSHLMVAIQRMRMSCNPNSSSWR